MTDRCRRSIRARALAGLLAGALAGGGLPAQAPQPGPAQPGPAQPPSPAPTGFPQAAHAPAGAPNILIVMTDDVGFGASSTFGGAIPTPTLDALARDGARYGEFHTASVCAASRAALLTGRNPHMVGAGSVPEMATPYPGYNSVLPKSAATFARVFQLAGYSTAMFGKHHNVPTWEDNPAGPITHKPNGLGFDYFYGFLSAATDQYRPALWENLNQVIPPSDDPGYILDRDLADHAVAWLRMQHTLAADRPFLLYYAPATLHAPVQAPREWIAKFRGRFDAGWDVLRREIYERQKRLGIIPANAALAPMPADTPKWDTLSPEQKRVSARFMEVYAAALAYCDDQIGRLIAELKRDDRYRNTLVVFIQGDNGASVEGGAEGGFSYNNRLNNQPERTEDILRHIDEIGGPLSMPVIPEGWTRATNAPFPWNKTIASHLGGTRNGLVLSWPGHVAAGQRMRYQFHHLIDIAPTLYEAAGITPPQEVDGAAQQPIEGVSMLYSLKDAAAASPRHEQVFETFGNMGLYEDGWLLSSTPASSGNSLYAAPKEGVSWELYDLAHDYSQAHDLAKTEPQRLASLVARFRTLAETRNLDPISRDMIGRMMSLKRPAPFAAPGLYRLDNSAIRYGSGWFPDIRSRSWSVAADVTAPAGGGDGMIVTQGGHFAGWGLMILDGRATLLYRRNEDDASLVRLVDPDRLEPGAHHVTLAFAADQPKPGTGGSFTISVDGHRKATLRVERTVPFSWYEDAEIGRDYGGTLSGDYRVPFTYPGTIAQVVFDTRGDAAKP